MLVDSGRFNIRGSSKKHTLRLQEGEGILQSYENDPSSLQIINDMTLLFKIQSASNPSHWYYVSMQCNYCDCPDWTSDCKHLYAVRLIIKKHFPHLQSILPIVDNAHALSTNHRVENEAACTNHVENVTTAVENNATNSFEVGDSEVLLRVAEVRNILSKIEEDLEKSDSLEKGVLLRQLDICKETLMSSLSPKEIQMPTRGSIRQIQANVTQTRLGHGKKLQSCVPSQDQIEKESCQPTKRACLTGVLRRKHQRGRHRVRFEERSRIWCPHCCTKTFMVDPLVTISCNTCHALLPLASRHAPIGVEASLINRDVRICDIPSDIPCKITSCIYGQSPNEERHFTLTQGDGQELCNVFASQWRLMLL